MVSSTTNLPWDASMGGSSSGFAGLFVFLFNSHATMAIMHVDIPSIMVP